MANERCACVYGEANLCIGMANAKARGCTKKRTYVSGWRTEKRACVRISEPVYRDSERKRCVRTAKRTSVSGWRTKDARACTEKRICISEWRTKETRGRTEERIYISGWRTKGVRGKRVSVRRSEPVYRHGERKGSVRVRRSESTYRDSERKKRAGNKPPARFCTEKRTCISG